jgi:hypothetical protein
MDGSRQIYLDEAGRNCSDRAATFRDMIAAEKATSLTGAAIQLVEALNRVDLLGSEETADRAELRAVNRLLYSVLDVVDGFAHRKLTEILPGTDNRHLDPWRPVEERLEQIRAGAAS